MSDFSPSRVLVLGGGSEIAEEFCKRTIDRGCRNIVLAGRLGGSVDEAAARLREAHSTATVTVRAFDAAASEHHGDLLRTLDETDGPFDCIVVAFGALGEPFTVDTDPAVAANLMDVNCTGGVSATLASLQVLRGEPDARLIIFSSIAAVRPRIGNLPYAAAKAGLDAFAVELAAPARQLGVDVVIVRPGFVHTRMTDGLDPAPFATTPEAVADDVLSGLDSGKSVIHSPAALSAVGLVLKNLPGPIWRKVSQR